MKSKNIYIVLIPIMLSFLTMGFVDLVGIATNYVKADFKLSDTMANMFPAMVFFWFLIFSVPTGMLMNKIGRRKTVVIGLFITALSLSIPLINYSFTSMLITFCLLGISNTLLQVSINPLLSTVISGNKLASYITFGQFVRAMASFSAPIIAAWAAASLDNWKYLFPIFMSIAVITTVFLGLTSIQEQKENGRQSSIKECFSLLGDKIILFLFFGILCHVGIDVGFNVTAPKILMERLNMPLNDAGYATSLYFLCRTTGCLIGAFLLTRISAKTIFTISVVFMFLSVIGLFIFNNLIALYVCIILIGLGNSNIFSIIISKALLYKPDKKNEISGLMIMGLFGGAIFPLLMGLFTDAINSQIGAIIVIAICVIYLFFVSYILKKEEHL